MRCGRLHSMLHRLFDRNRPLLLLAAVSAILLACDRQPASRFQELKGEVVSSERVLLALDRYWNLIESPGESPNETYYEVLPGGALHVIVSEAGGGSLHFEMQVAGAGSKYVATWDKEELPATLSEELLTVEVPEHLNTVGRHELRLFSEDTNSPVRLAALRFRSGNETGVQELLKSEFPRLRELGIFIEHGIAGPWQDKQAGLAFAGPGRRALPVEKGHRRKIYLDLTNLSTVPARFEVLVGSNEMAWKVEGYERVTVRVPVIETTRSIQVEVDGSELGLFLWNLQEPEAVDQPLPAIVLVTLDTTRRDALSIYDGPAGLTPNLERFAASAAVFDRAYVTSPWTIPSHASIFTGLYPSRHGGGVTSDRLPADHDTLVEILDREGYFTVGVAGGGLVAPIFGLAQGFDVFHQPAEHEMRGDEVTDRALQEVDRHIESPIFLFVNYFDPHGLYQAPRPWEESLGVFDLASEFPDDSKWARFGAGDPAGWAEVLTGSPDLTEPERQLLRAKYLAEVAYMDFQLGKLLSGLEDRGLLEDALVVITSDHGESLGEYRHLTHSYRLDPPLIDAPLIVRWPGQKTGYRDPHLASIVDIYPTVLDVFGEKRPSQGVALSRTEARVQSVFMEEHVSPIHFLDPARRLGEHLYGEQLLENRRVAWVDGEECRRLREGKWVREPCPANLFERLSSELKPLGPGAYQEGRRDGLSEEEKKRLRALGYLE